MPGDVQLSASQVKSAPLDYTVPASALLRLKAVSALFTDNGAGGDWLPAVVLLSDSGHVIARAADPGVKVTSGDDAEVSWFPGVKPTAAAAATVQSFLRVGFNLATPSGSIPLGTGTVPTIAQFDTNDSARFVQTDTQHWTMTRGAYLVTGFIRSNTGDVVTTNGSVAAQILSGGGYVAETGVGTGENIVSLAIADLTLGDQGGGSQWHGALGGTDTQQWAFHAKFVYLLGTGAF